MSDADHGASAGPPNPPPGVGGHSIFRSVVWQALPPVNGADDTLPHATHRGTLNIGGCELECFQLSDGQRVFSEKSVARFFDLSDGEPEGRSPLGSAPTEETNDVK